VKVLIQRAIIGGTDAWLDINDDYDHLENANDVTKGYKKEDETMKDGPYGPYYEPKGNGIEKAMLQFLLDNGVDVNAELTYRNRY